MWRQETLTDKSFDLFVVDPDGKRLRRVKSPWRQTTSTDVGQRHDGQRRRQGHQLPQPTRAHLRGRLIADTRTHLTNDVTLKTGAISTLVSGDDRTAPPRALLDRINRCFTDHNSQPHDSMKGWGDRGGGWLNRLDRRWCPCFIDGRTRRA